MSKIWLSADYHFNHDRKFIYEYRGFNSIEEMNNAIINRHNSVVSNDDDVYILGDLILGNLEKGIECIKQLNGRLHIVCGNHCTDRRIEEYKKLPNVVEVAWAVRLRYKKHHFFMSHFPSMTGNLEKESLAQCTLNFYGHTHQKSNFYEDRPYMYHVGVDSHDCYPILIDEALAQMYAKVEECKSFLGLEED